MVRIPYVKIPSVRVGSVGSTSNIGTGGATPAPPTPITYLTQWKIVGNSEVHTLPYPDGVVLPTGYKRCKYLEFHGTEYIDSGIIPEQGMSVSIDFEYTNFGSTDYGIIGCREEYSSVDCLYLLCQRANHQICAFYGGAVITQHTPSNPSIPTNERILITIDSEQVEIRTPNDTFVNTHTNSITKGVRTIYVGVVNNAGYAKSSYKLYSLKMSLSNEYVFNGIPCLDDNNIPCLYDTVSGTSFYNDDTGTFGYEIEPQPTEIWSCGEYSDVDNKYHVVILPTDKQAVDIVLNEPLRKTDNTADTLEYPTETSGKALLTIRVEESGGELSPLDTPTTELVDAPQIEEAESYTCVISQGAKAVEWSSFSTNSE